MNSDDAPEISSLPPERRELIHLLMDSLYTLYKRLSHTGNNPQSMNVLKSYNYFTRESKKGKHCTYALKTLNLFTTQDYNDIKELILEVLKNIREIEGDSFGK